MQRANAAVWRRLLGGLQAGGCLPFQCRV